MKGFVFYLAVFIQVCVGSAPSSAQERTCAILNQDDISPTRSYANTLPFSISQFRIKNTEYTIPVIVHIVHDGEDIGSGSNIGLEQVLSQFVVLNNDFNRLNADTILTPEEFLEVAGRMNIIGLSLNKLKVRHVFVANYQ